MDRQTILKTLPFLSTRSVISGASRLSQMEREITKLGKGLFMAIFSETCKKMRKKMEHERMCSSFHTPPPPTSPLGSTYHNELHYLERYYGEGNIITGRTSLNLHQCLWTHLEECGSKRLGCHPDLYTVSKCHTRGQSEDHIRKKTCKGSTLV